MTNFGVDFTQMEICQKQGREFCLQCLEMTDYSYSMEVVMVKNYIQTFG